VHLHRKPGATLSLAKACAPHQEHAFATARKHGTLQNTCHGTLAVLVLALLAAALGVAAGCARTREPIVLRPLQAEPGAARQPVFRVRLVRLLHRIRPDAPLEDLWRLLGTTDVPYEKRGLWEANDLALGEGARLAAERMNELLVQTSDRSASVVELVVRENMDFRITLGAEREELEVLWTDALGRLSGRRFIQAVPGFRFVCRRDPADPALVRLAFVPEVVYGKEVTRWAQTPAGPIQRVARQEFTASDLAAEVRLGAERLLVIGGRRRSPVSLGGALFFEPRGPDLWAQTLILSAEEILLKDAPEGTTVPFMPPAK